MRQPFPKDKRSGESGPVPDGADAMDEDSTMDSESPVRSVLPQGRPRASGPLAEEPTLDPEALSDPTGADMDMDALAMRLAARDSDAMDRSLSDSILGQISVPQADEVPSLVGMLHAVAADEDTPTDEGGAASQPRPWSDPLTRARAVRDRPLTFAGAPVPAIGGYQILSQLGRGATGTVFKAFDDTRQRYVAIKMMEPRHMAQPMARARLQRELRLCARLDHPGLARLLDSGVVAGISYYVMELIDGPTLDHYVRQQSLNHQQIVHLMIDVCEAIEYTHQRGIVHRDLKPSNIVMDPTGRPRVIDFGLAKAILDDQEQSVSVEGQVTGTPAYMSPEQAAGRIRDIDQRTDVYGLGTILFRLVTGQYAHRQEGPLKDILHRIALEPTRRAREIDPNIDEQLDGILWRATANHPTHRFKTAGDMASALREYLQQRRSRGSTVVQTDEPPAWPVALVARKLGITELALRQWMQQASFAAPAQGRRAEELADENARLTRVVAEMAMENQRLRDEVRRRG